MLNFDFLEKSMRRVSPSHFVHNCHEKYFSCYIIFSDLIFLSDCLYVLRYWIMRVLVLLGCDTINYEINFIFLIKLFLYFTKKSRQKCKYLDSETNF